MKKCQKNIILTILSALVLFLVSCSSTVDYIDADYDFLFQNFEYVAGDDAPYEYNCINGGNRIQQSDGIIYFFDSIATDKKKTLYKLTPETGLIVNICSDPLCNHSSPDCKLFGSTNLFYVYNDKVFFKRIYFHVYYNDDGTIRSRAKVSDSVQYDLKNAKLTVIESYDSMSSMDYLSQLFYKNYRYYYDYVYDESIDKHIFKMCRLNIDTGEISFIGGDNNIDAATERFVFALEDRIYFTDGKSLYSKNIDNADKKLHCTGEFYENINTDGKNVYFDLQNDNGGRDVYVLTDINDYASAKLIIKGCGAWYLTQNYIYYCDTEKRVIGKSNLSGYAKDEVVLSGKRIRRCDHNGETDEVIFTYEDEYANYQISSMLILDNYIYGEYYYYDDSDGDGILQDTDTHHSNIKGDYSIMRIDVSSGDVYIIRQ